MSSIKVCKFGGTSNADANSIEKVVDIIKADKSRQYVVVSAPGRRFPGDEKVTDLLYKCCDEFHIYGSIKNTFQKIRDRFEQIVNELNLDLDIVKILDETEAQMLESGGDKDFCASRGEYLNARILACKLGYEFVDAKDIIKFDDDGVFNSEYTNDICKDFLSKIPCAVIPGFYGDMPNKKIKTFSRGGSDISGAIVARAIDAEVYENWTDVDGVLVADPRIVPNAKIINMLTYKELRELAYMGASVLHEDAIFPVCEADIAINIRNTFNPNHPGTMIVPNSRFLKAENIITGIAGTKGYSAIHLEKSMMNSETGFVRKVLSVLERYNVSFEHLPTGIDTMTVIVDSQALEDGVKDIIVEKIAKATNCDVITVDDNLALIAIVGHGMQKKKGVASRLFSSIAEADINIKMIDQGSSEINIIIAIDGADYSNCINAIYNEFFK